MITQAPRMLAKIDELLKMNGSLLAHMGSLDVPANGASTPMAQAATDLSHRGNDSANTRGNGFQNTNKIFSKFKNTLLGCLIAAQNDPVMTSPVVRPSQPQALDIARL